MHLSMLLDMAADAFGDRIAVGSRHGGMTYTELRDRVGATGAWLRARDVERAALVDVSSDAVPLLLYGAAAAGMPFVPLSYRLTDEALQALVRRTAPSVVVVEDRALDRIGTVEGVEVVARSTFLAEVAAPGGGAGAPEGSVDDIAILLFTSGTTGDPKAAVLRHRHLASYIIGTVDFMGAGEDEAALVSVPPYHVAGTSAVLSSVYAGRRVVYLPDFTPEAWVSAARDEEITHAMVVPTMLGRVLDVVERTGGGLPALRHLSYGGGRMPVPVIERALALLPNVDFVNAYGLTETSSTISVLDPEDHRAAAASDDPVVRGRLGSVGRPLPTLELDVRDPLGRPVAPGEAGELWVRGEQVAGEYLGRPEVLEDGWFPTRDTGWIDGDGYLFLDGRLDDVIVRGGENLSPGEIEEALRAHPAVVDAGVVGVPDIEWGEAVVAAVVLDGTDAPDERDLQDWVRERLRSTRTPEHIEVRPALPYSETGKLLRRALRAELAATYGTAST